MCSQEHTSIYRNSCCGCEVSLINVINLFLTSQAVTLDPLNVVLYNVTVYKNVTTTLNGERCSYERALTEKRRTLLLSSRATHNEAICGGGRSYLGDRNPSVRIHGVTSQKMVFIITYEFASRQPRLEHSLLLQVPVIHIIVSLVTAVLSFSFYPLTFLPTY
jgi:hypothetical protein